MLWFFPDKKKFGQSQKPNKGNDTSLCANHSDVSRVIRSKLPATEMILREVSDVSHVTTHLSTKIYNKCL